MSFFSAIRGSLYKQVAGRAAKKYADQIRETLSEEEWQELLELYELAYKNSESFRMFLLRSASTSLAANTPPDIFALLSAENILANPMLIPYRRPAMRLLCPTDIPLIDTTPMIVLPSSEPCPYACEFETSSRKYIGVPFGMLAGLSSVGRVVLQIVEGQNGTDTNLREIRGALLDLHEAWKSSNLMLSFDTSPPNLQYVQTVHVLGVFLLLHECGHVALSHRQAFSASERSPGAIEQLHSQEYEADAYALQALLRHSDPQSIPWDSLRVLHFATICTYLLAVGVVVGPQASNSHPAAIDRVQKLTFRFHAPTQVLAHLIKVQHLLS